MQISSSSTEHFSVGIALILLQSCLSRKFQFVKIDKALELHVLSAPQGHTIPSGATVITENAVVKFFLV